MTDEQFKTMWANSAHTLEALYKTIKDLAPPYDIKAIDFDTPNHYAKLVWNQGRQEIVNKILDLFPQM